MIETKFDYNGEISWCPGCGDFKILEALKLALSELALEPNEVVVVSGIGQAAKMPHYLRCHCVNGLHGRALPLATGVKASNPNLTVIAVGGDGDMYGEGGNHFLHAIRRNPNITNIVCNNMIYGLTKGQGSPTTPIGTHTSTQPGGVVNRPLNPLLLALSCGATFVARGSAADVDRTKELLKQAISHKGYALVDILQPCVSFNKTHSWQWLATAAKWIEGEGRDEGDISVAMSRALESDPFPLGIIYRAEPGKTFEETQAPYRSGDTTPLFARLPRYEAIERLIG
ncbi:thiamine pyrophosphate-dependent enzyme [Synergistaceae bacterium OttesenSCG-928-I11]|nr:thiamine pyrophosphate-dependent enzyme [Synergistaceae bacterium OttesenSCG-928-I11]